MRSDMMILRPTRGGLLFIAASAASVGVALMNVALITALVASVLCAFLLCSLLCSLLSSVGFRVERLPAEEGCCQEEISLPLKVKNLLPFFRQDCVVCEELPFSGDPGKTAFEIPCLAPQEELHLDRKIRAVKRGSYSLKKLFLRSGDPAGLFIAQKSFSLPGEVLITPKVVLPGLIEGDSQSGNSFTYEGRSTARAGLGNDFYGVRPYRAGDEMRHIHWRISASKQHLMVREFEALAMDHVTLVLDTDIRKTGMDEMENNFEKLLSLALSLCAYFAKQSCHVSLLLRYNGYGVTHLKGEGAFLYSRIREILTGLQCSPGAVADLITENLELFPAGEQICILSMSNDPALHNAITLLEEHKCSVILFYAPGACFPFIPEDEPVQYIREEMKTYRDNARRYLITCQTSFDELKIFHDAEL